MAGNNGRRGGSTDTFDAGVYGTLRYDFKKFGGVQGIIPDPSDQQLEDFMRGMRDAAKEYSSEDLDDDKIEDMSAEELSELLDDDSSMRIKEAQEKIAGLVAELCSGSPNQDELLRLPFRVRQGFLRWLQGKLINPESEAADTTPSRVTRLGG